MDRLDAMSIVLAVAEAGSLSAAARQLKTPLATVSRKVSDLFIDAKIPKSDRPDHLVVASSSGEVLFIRGLRPSEIAAPTEATVRWLGLAALP